MDCGNHAKIYEGIPQRVMQLQIESASKSCPSFNLEDIKGKICDQVEENIISIDASRPL